MNAELWGNSTVHTLILSAIGLAIVFLYRDVIGVPAILFVAGAPLVTWGLGRIHERAIYLEARVANEADLREARRKAGGGLFSRLTSRDEE
jgi:hypothetical protein